MFLKKSDIINYFKDVLKFDIIGFSDGEKISENLKNFYFNWLDKKYHGDMDYLEKYIDIKFNPENFFFNTKTIISVGLNYYQKRENNYFSIYSYGRDYHKVIRKKLKKAQQYLLKYGINSRIGVDSAPIFEKYWGYMGGLGFIGKNGLLINEKLGSFFFLGEIFIDKYLKPDIPIKDGCGDCNLCIINCPTGAIKKGNVIDSRRCISYLTIEYSGFIDEKFWNLMKDSIFGCDRCQLICPKNRSILKTEEKDFNYRYQGVTIDHLLDLNEEQFKKMFEGSVIRRAGYNHFMEQVKRVNSFLKHFLLGSGS